DGLSYRMGSPEGCARWLAANAAWDASDRNAAQAAYHAACAFECSRKDPTTFDVTVPGAPMEGDPNERWAQIELLRCIVGNPFRPVRLDPHWQTSPVIAIARQIYEDHACDHLPILADALADAGCIHAGVLEHCREGTPHARGCWPVDLLLGKS